MGKRLKHHKNEKAKAKVCEQSKSISYQHFARETSSHRGVCFLFITIASRNLFKTWKSIFHIYVNKRMKLERFQCQLYGQLLRLCLVASVTYQMRRLLWEKQGKEMSELKCAYMVQIYL